MRHSTGSIKEDRALPALGDRVEVWWKDDKRYYPGSIVALQANGKIKVHYDDGDKESLDFRKERWRVLRSAESERERERERRHTLEPPRKRASAAVRAKGANGTPTSTQRQAQAPAVSQTMPATNTRKRTMSSNGNTSASCETSAADGSSAKRARNEDEVTPATAEKTKEKESAAVKPSTQTTDPVVSSTVGATINSTSGVEATVTIQDITKVMSSVLANESVEWRKRNSALQRRLTAVEMKLADATTEISALRGQLAALRAVSPPQAAAARDAVRDVVHEMARAVLRDNEQHQQN